MSIVENLIDYLNEHYATVVTTASTAGSKMAGSHVNGSYYAGAKETYDWLMSIGDPRVENWFLMSSPWPTVILSASYVYCCKVLGPTLMKDRQPFNNLKIPMQIYNLFQVALSAYVVYEACANGWLTTYSWGNY